MEKFNNNRRNSEQSKVPVKTVLEDTTQNTFLTTCDVWQDSNLMKFIEKNTEDGRIKLQKEMISRHKMMNS